MYRKAHIHFVGIGGMACHAGAGQGGLQEGRRASSKRLGARRRQPQPLQEAREARLVGCPLRAPPEGVGLNKGLGVP